MDLFPARLLIDLPNWVGDQVMAMPAVDRLARANAAGETVLHVRPPVRRLFQEVFTHNLVVTSERRAFPFADALRIWRRHGRFEVGVSLRHASRAKIFLRLAARRTFASSGRGASVLLTGSFPVDRGRHQLFDYDRILEGLGLAAVDPAWRLPLPESLIKEGADIIADAGIGDMPLVGLAPAAASGVSKQWPAGSYGRLARRLLGRGVSPVLVVGPGEETVASDVQSAAGTSLPVVGPSTDVAGLAAILAHVALLVCNDSGPMHLAAMLGRRVVALFGPTDSGRTGPLGPDSRIVDRAMECAPCLQRSCPLEHNLCLHGLDVAAVEEVVLSALDGVGRLG